MLRKFLFYYPQIFLLFSWLNPPLYIYNDATLTIIEKIIEFAWAIFSELGLCPF
ncbi:hypothetical protein BMQ_pBM60005 (plasmid) [Priestia megaterium QM B1551]|uniref:Uncharacterized protein n=1 Tax=Priestia megaterium (strain ATCC 12872 / QMB1551) TaxID=545693 RepID=D5E3R3_PRIM1|nr:hypothetical protein BMQ_pBM60005 [Priestia megaterium QM B1551]